MTATQRTFTFRLGDHVPCWLDIGECAYCRQLIFVASGHVPVCRECAEARSYAPHKPPDPRFPQMDYDPQTRQLELFLSDESFSVTRIVVPGMAYIGRESGNIVGLYVIVPRDVQR